MKKLINNPLLYIGIVIKLIAIVAILPSYVVDSYYAPFLENSIKFFSIDPWSSWLANSGSLLAFPYGYSMWLTFMPFSLFGSIFNIPFALTYSLTLLISDFMLLVVLNKILPNRERLVLYAYWLSPVIFLGIYGLGLNDVIPALYLMIGILYLKRHKLILSGIFLAAATSAKLSMIIVIPFVVLYIYNNKPLRALLLGFIGGLLGIFIIIGIPFLLSNAARTMLFKNSEMLDVLTISFGLTQDLYVYFLPILYSVILYFVWRARRLNFDLFMAISGILFLTIVILMPTSSGWFIWAVPFLIFYQAMSGRTSVVIITLFSIFFALNILFNESFYLYNGNIIDFKYTRIGALNLSSIGINSIINTGIFSIGIILAIRMWRESINDNDFFQRTRSPFVLGIAGDSGSGKDTLSDAIAGIFGKHSITKISGDDYHIWDRYKPMWQVITHLNPMANNLESFSQDVFSLKDRKTINARTYNHKTGKMSKHARVNSNDFIITSGLHALYLPQLRNLYNLKVYLDIDEDLRRHFKIKRDVGIRGHKLNKVLESMEIREKDSDKFIRPQKKHAHLILSLQPIRSLELVDNIDESVELKVVATTFNGLSEINLNRVLVGLCGLHVEMDIGNDGSRVQMTIEGDPSKEDIAYAVKILCPNLFEFFDLNPEWHGGTLGIMQLITLFHINQIFIGTVKK